MPLLLTLQARGCLLGKLFLSSWPLVSRIVQVPLASDVYWYGAIEVVQLQACW